MYQIYTKFEADPMNVPLLLMQPAQIYSAADDWVLLVSIGMAVSTVGVTVRSLGTRDTVMGVCDWSTIGVVVHEGSRFDAVSLTELGLSSHTVVRTVEVQVGDAGVSLDAGSLLKPSRDVIGDFTEDSYLALDNLLLFAILHMARNVADETLPSVLIPDFLPQGARSVEILRRNLGKERNSATNKFAMNLISIRHARLVADRFNRRKIVRAGAMIQESHLTITLETTHVIFDFGGIDR